MSGATPSFSTANFPSVSDVWVRLRRVPFSTGTLITSPRASILEGMA
jgi:hypothetical protein